MLKILTLLLTVILFSTPAFARMDVNQYWSIDRDSDSCNVLTNYQNGKAMWIIANADGLHIILKDPLFNRIEDSKYWVIFSVDNADGLAGQAVVKGNVIIIPSLTASAAQKLMLANYVEIGSGNYHQQFGLVGSAEAIAAVIQCAVKSGYSK